MDKISRPLYLEKLKKYIDVPVVKVLAGIRRCGKSSILELLEEELKKKVKKDHIINVNYASEKYKDYTSTQMYEDINKKIVDDDTYYLLLDEIQEINGWERVINSFMEEKKVDIYVTGSNSKLMSSEIETYLTGRFVTIPVYTLSFKEYVEFRGKENKSSRDLLNDYIRFGGFPLPTIKNLGETETYEIVEGIYNTVVVNDIRKRHKIQDEDMFERVVKYVVENVGQTFSASSICNYFKSEHRVVRLETVLNYLEWLEKSFIIYRCKRFDLKGKEVLKTQEKFYLADQSIKYCLFGFSPSSISSMMENIVYFELKRRGYDVYIGKLQTQEIDFVATRREEKVYIQVCRNMPENSDRELNNLRLIKDNYPKYVVTLDNFAVGNEDGIKIINMVDFLLGEI